MPLYAVEHVQPGITKIGKIAFSQAGLQRLRRDIAPCLMRLVRQYPVNFIAAGFHDLVNRILYLLFPGLTRKHSRNDFVSAEYC